MASKPPTSLDPNSQKPPLPRPRKKQAANPLVANRRPPPKPKASQPTASKATPTNISAGTIAPNVLRRSDFTERQRSPTPEGEPSVYPVYMTPNIDLENTRCHIARLQSKKDVRIEDESIFTRPVRLYRRDPAAEPDAPELVEADPEQTEKEKELELIKVERQRRREEIMKMIAPTATKKKNNPSKLRIDNRGPETPEEEKRRLLRYEEALPWHIEDFDNKHIWVGSLEASLSESNILLYAEPEGFRVVPLEKVYRFKERNHIESIPEDLLKAYEDKRIKEPRWILARKKKEEEQIKKEKTAQRAFGLFKRAGEKEGSSRGGEELFELGGGAEEGDLDFDANELFDDDEENPIFEGDEDDQKDAKDRIQKDQRNANYFDQNDEADVDKEEEKEDMLAELQRQLGKGTRKNLVALEKNVVYEDSDEENPYSEESEDADEEGSDDDKKEDGTKANGEKSGTSVKGENTPSDRKKYLKPGQKRPGSPNLSEASGNESSRKKAKIHGLKKSLDIEASGASGNESTLSKKKKTLASTLVKPKNLGSFRSGSGSESESMKRSRVGNLSARASPINSRPNSPAGTRINSKVPSRATSPTTNGPPSGSTTPLRKELPTIEQLQAAVPPEGMTMSELANKFPYRSWNQEEKAKFMSMAKNAFHFDKETKRVTVRK